MRAFHTLAHELIMAARCAVLASVMLASAAGAAQSQSDDSREALGVGDNIRVTVFQNPDLTTETRISEKGTILFPMIGEVAVSGHTPSGAANVIADRLKRGRFLNNPQVTVSLTQLRSRQVSVLGQVVKPGRYPLDDTSAKLTDLLALAGGVGPPGAGTISRVPTCYGRWRPLVVGVGG